MKNFTQLCLLAALTLSFTTSLALGIDQIARDNQTQQAREPEQKLNAYGWFGEACVSEYQTGEEMIIFGRGIVHAASRPEARELAKLAMRHQASDIGTILKLSVDLTGS